MIMSMIKNKFVLASGISLAISSSAFALDFSAQSQDYKFFVNPFAGYAVDTEEAYLGAAIGMTNGESSFAFQYGHLGFDLPYFDNWGDLYFVDVDINTYSVGYTHTFPLQESLNFYVGGSVGAATLAAGGFDDTLLFFDLKAGLEAELNDNLSLQVGVRYLYLGEGDWTVSVDDVSVEVGAKIRF